MTQHKNNTSSYLPVFIPGEKYSIIVNVAIDINQTAKFCILANGVKIIIGTMVEIGNYYSITFTMPSVDKGFGVFIIADGPYDVYKSNVISISNNKNNTSKVKFRHNAPFFGVNYPANQDFYQELRLHINAIDMQPEFKQDLYRSSSSGKLRTYKATLDRAVKFESYYFDDEAHEAATCMVGHDEIYIDGKKYTFKEGYKIKTSSDVNISKGEFEMYEESFTVDAKKAIFE